MPTFTDRLQHAWNAFMSRDPTRYNEYSIGYFNRPDRPYRRIGNERSIIMAIYNRIAMDVASVDIKHVRLDENDAFIEEIKSGLNNCLQIEANIDQTARAFIQELVLSLFDEGCIAVVPVETNISPINTGSYDIETMRTAKIVQWYPEKVTVELYNDKTGRHQQVTLPKTVVAIIENPLYAIMNEPNSILQRLLRKLTLLDAVDEQSSAGKLDLIIQLPYVIKTDARRKQAEERRKQIEMQLAGTKYGIAYTDGTERITQLNRPIENNLMKQIEYLTSMLYSQLGISEALLNGTADEKELLNYNNRIVEPILSAICDAFKRTFLTKTARTQRQDIRFFREPFKLVPVDNIAEIADKFTRNEILSSNEIRQIIGFKPSNDPKADELQNANLNHPESEGGDLEALLGQMEGEEGGEVSEEGEEDIEGDEDIDYDAESADLDDLDAQLDELEKLLHSDFLAHYASPYYDPVKAHEYYMKHRELKKRRSTADLNDEGKAAAKYVRDRLLEERRRRISASSERKKSNTKASSQAAKSNIAYRNAIAKDAIKGSSERTKSAIQSSSQSVKADVKSSSESTKKRIQANRSKVKTQIESGKKKMQSSIDNLRQQLKAMNPQERKKQKDRFANLIAKLRERNASIREKLNASHKTYSSQQREGHKNYSKSRREQHKSYSEQHRQSHKNFSAQERANQKADNAYERQAHKDRSESYKQEHKNESAAAKADYERKYDAELAKIKGDKGFARKKRRRR